MSTEGEELAPDPEPNPDGQAPTGVDVRIVAVGASAGGLKAVSELLQPLPADFELAIVVVMHLDPTHPSSLVELLGRACRLPVHQATEGLELEEGHVYVIPPNIVLSLQETRLHLAPREVSTRPQLPIDQFLMSLAEEQDGRSIGVILSGTGSDGTAGLQSIAAEGGITFAQDETATFHDMPANAVAANCVDAVLPPRGIAKELIKISQHPSRWLYDEAPEGSDGSDGSDQTERALSGLVRRISRITGIDFINYKQTSIRRRILRRLLLLGLERVDQYVAYLQKEPEEVERLCHDILIRVTSFFRDPAVFEALKKSAFSAIMEGRTAGDTIRIWVPGCASGEEVYSLAMGLLELMEQRATSFPVKLFGTDVAAQAIAVARSGWYPERITADVSPERLRRFFVKDEGGFTVTKAVRDLCVFARQDATRDPPFSNLDLISCRNLLIYLGPILQKKLIPLFHYALRDGGYLLLGTSESVGAMGEMFAVVDEGNSLFVCKPVPRRLPVELGRNLPGVSGGVDAASHERTLSGVEVQREADRILLMKFAPPGVLIDEELEILRFRGDTGAYLAPAPGSPSNNLFRMAREGLLPDLRSIIEEGKQTGLPARRTGLQVKSAGRVVRADLELVPIRIPGSAARCFAILFHETPEADAAHPARDEEPTPFSADPGHDSTRAERLERELVATRDYLRSNVERVEITNEELSAANEEILSSNEELQSTNEELQTTQEELQATNEELLTTNEQLRHRNREVALLNDDLSNLLASVRIPIVIVGRGLNVRKFTPAAARLFALESGDIGRSLFDRESGIDMSGVKALVLEVLDTLTPAEQELRDEQGSWHAVRIRPYRTTDDRVAGAVIALSDIDKLKRLSQDLERARDFGDSVLNSVGLPLLVVDAEQSVRMANSTFHETFGTTPDAVQDRRLGADITESWLISELQQMVNQVIHQGAAVASVTAEGELPGKGARLFKLDARAVLGDGERERLVLLAIEDVTDEESEREERERLTSELQESQRLESLGILAGGIAHDFNNILTAILGFAELIQSDLPPGSKSLGHAEMIARSASSAAALCNEMLAYSGRGRFQVEVIDLNELVRQSFSLLEAMVHRESRIQLELAPTLPVVEADAVQLRQVLANLVINASEAFAEEGGTISLSTGVMEIDAEYLGGCVVGDVPPGEYVCLEVRDDGSGMTPETRARIFDPFFTTKFTGRGLGLAAVLGIIRSHQGALSLDSKPGGGSSFRLLLPSRVRPALATASPQGRDVPLWKGEGEVLVVDDELTVRSFLGAALPHLGFQVVTASNGAEAVELIRASSQQPDVVLLDLTMPGLSGAETHQAMRALRPELRIILMSGFDEAEATSGIPPSRLAGFLRKPFLLDDLAASLRNALAQEGDGDPLGTTDP
jgi:two-component system CheB/CheR fusion protein